MGPFISIYDILRRYLKVAEQNLRKFRENEDAGGGVSNKPAGRTQMLGGRSGAPRSSIFAAVASLMLVMFM